LAPEISVTRRDLGAFLAADVGSQNQHRDGVDIDGIEATALAHQHRDGVDVPEQ